MDRFAGFVVRGLLVAGWVALSGCANEGGLKGFGPPSASSSSIVPTGDVPASKSMIQKYGITHWRMFSGVNHTVVTGYKADGTAARGVDIAWFKRAADGTPGHLRLTMLDGSGAIVRRYVGGKATGQLSADQMELVVTQQVDMYEHVLSLVPSKQKKAKAKARPLAAGGGSLHLLDDSSGSAPNTGPQCSAALMGGNTDGASCVLDLTGAMLSSETILGAMAGLGQGAYDCGSWAIQNNNVQSTCETENMTHCTVAQDGGWENCDFSGEQQSGSSSGATPTGGGLSQQDLCANYPDSAACSNLVKTNGFCSASTDCTPGDECNQGFCSTAGYTGVPGDDCTNPDAVKYGGSACSSSSAPTDQEVGSASNSNCLSCAPGSSDVTPNPQNGDVSSGSGSDSSGSSSGGSTGGGSGSSSGGGSGDDPGDPGGSLGGSAPSCAGQSGDCSNGGSCCSPLVCDPGTSTCVTTDQMMGGSCTAYYGDACSSDSDCCLGTCDPSSSTCSSGSSGSSSGGSSGGGSGSSSGGSSSGSSSGGSCASDGAACAADSDCCSGTCDTSSGTCGSTSGSSSGGSSSGSSSGGSCASDGAACAADSDCCSGTCDTSSGTCGSTSGSSSGGSSSGSSSGGSCTADGNSCASASDCCSGVCGSCDGLCGGNSAGASGAPCSSDADCCNSCDTTNGVCL